ncbi:phage tail tape measure protein [Methylobacterium thuringiense]|uniref:Phage tail tape measure protein domain-containing protein n=1 Tax=Methylobacterium thuringiense TaxID=1003091 RepID=A0ABQ4TIF7_9HYPH|nr:phage tail tape measure protein [Methylobacterium thuringiense]GJE54582.1 hypothetical protein EKPJFOCH_1060 [Methylobacterium thuringiense]
MARIIEAKAIISAEDRLSKVLDGIGKKFRDFGKGVKVGANLDGLNKSLDGTKRQLEALGRINAAQSRLTGSKMGLFGVREQAERLTAALAAAKKAGDAGAVSSLTAQSRTAQRAVAQAAGAIERQAAAVRDAKRAFADFGVPVTNLVAHENALRSSVEKTTTALRRQAVEERRRQEMTEKSAVRSQARRDALTGVGATAGVLAAHKGKQIGLEAVNSAADFDYAVRYQHIVSDVSEADQQKLLIPQAKRIGQETKFSNLDVVKAQTATMQSLPFQDPRMKAEVGASIVDQARNYAVIMEADMKESAEGIRSFLQATNKDISTKEKAVAEATRATNLIVKMSKLGGMNNEDAQQFIKYGFPTGTQTGLSDTTLGALGSVGRRSGLRGDEIGTFARAAASKLVSPTQKGMDALAVAGVDYNKFSTMPGGLSADNLEGLSKRRFGKGFTEDQRGRLRDLLENGDVVSNRDEFTKQVSEIVEEGFGKTKSGKTRAQDSQKIAKMVGDFHKLSAESVDTEGLLREILTNPKMTAALRNAFFTDKHGGKAGILSQHMDQFGQDKAALDAVTNEPSFSGDKAKYMTEGLGGAIDNLKGSFETLVLNIGNANAGLVKFAADGISSVADAFSNLSSTSQQILSLMGGTAAAGGGIYGAMKFMGAIFGAGGGAAALGTSAVALDGSAAALTAAALKLGGGSLPDVAGKMSDAAKTTGGAAAGATAGGVAGPAILAGGILAGALADQASTQAFGTIADSARALADLAKKSRASDFAAGALGYQNPGGRALQMPDGASSGAGYPTRYEAPRGAISRFLNGPDMRTQTLPGFGSGDKRMPSLDSIKATIDTPIPVNVTGEVTGTGTLTATVTVTESPNFTARMNGIDAKLTSLSGKLSQVGTNGPGSTGKSSPDAGKGGRD